MKQCQGTKADGTPCSSPFVGADGFCGAHGPGASERMRQRGIAGGRATAEKFRRVFDADRLPRLTTPEDAQVWLEAIARAVGAQQLTDRQANAMTKALETWLKSRSALDAEQAEKLRTLLDELKKRRSA